MDQVALRDPLAGQVPIKTIEQVASELIDRANKAKAIADIIEKVKGFGIGITKDESSRPLLIVIMPSRALAANEKEFVEEIFALGKEAKRNKLMLELGAIVDTQKRSGPCTCGSGQTMDSDGSCCQCRIGERQ